MTVDQILAYCKIMLEEGWGYILGTAGVKWTAEKQAKATDSMAQKYGSKWIGKMVIDCSGVMVYIWKKFGKKIYHGSNSIARYSVGAISKVPKPGYAAFKWKSQDTSKFQDGRGDYYHIGIVDENAAYVYEARGTRDGFCHDSPVTKWAYFAPFKDVDYSESAGQQKKEKGEMEMDILCKAEIVTKNGGNVNLRSGPGKEYPVIKSYPTGTKLEIKVEYENNWDCVQIDGKIGYMHADYIQKIEDEKPAEQNESGKAEDMKDEQQMQQVLEWHIPLEIAIKYRAVLEDMLEAIGKGVDSFGGGQSAD